MRLPNSKLMWFTVVLFLSRFLCTSAAFSTNGNTGYSKFALSTKSTFKRQSLPVLPKSEREVSIIASRKKYSTIDFSSLILLTRREVYMNAIQFLLLHLISISLKHGSLHYLVCESKVLDLFPSVPMKNHYKSMSTANWFVHFLTQVYGLGAIFRLLENGNSGKKKSDNSGREKSIEKQRTSFAVVFGLQLLMGNFLILSHALIGENTKSFAIGEQRLYNIAMYLLKLSTFICGFVLRAPIWGWVTIVPVSLGTINQKLMMENLSGIILSTFGMCAMMASPNDAFPILFKAVYLFLPLISTVVKTCLSGMQIMALDLYHVATATVLCVSMIMMRFSLRNRYIVSHNKESFVNKER